MTIPISVTVTGGNIKKSAAVAETIQEALAEKGFTDVKYVNRPFTKPQAVGEQGQTKSLLDQIQATYPTFLEDPIEVRAVPVAGLDLAGEKELEPYWRADTDEHNVAKSFAQVDIDKTGRGEMQIFFTGEGYPPRQDYWADNPDMVLVVMRAADIAIARKETLDDKHYSQAAKELTAEGKIGPNKKTTVDSVVEDVKKDMEKRLDKNLQKNHLRVVETEEP